MGIENSTEKVKNGTHNIENKPFLSPEGKKISKAFIMGAFIGVAITALILKSSIFHHTALKGRVKLASHQLIGMPQEKFLRELILPSK